MTSQNSWLHRTMNAANQAQNMQKWGEEDELAGRKSVKKACFIVVYLVLIEVAAARIRLRCRHM